MPHRIAQERVPTASNVGSRDVTWASQPTPLIPFRVFSRVSRAPFLQVPPLVPVGDGFPGKADASRTRHFLHGRARYDNS